MGRLPLVILACAAVACDEPGKASSSGRSEQVVASSTTTTATATATTSVAHAAPAAPRGPLCDKGERALSKVAPVFVNEQGERTEHSHVPLEDKHLLWVNFFAAWCGPCKEEIPRIQRFEKQLQKDGVPVEVAFVSIDDDLRQLTGFYAQQPTGGIKSSFWLPDGATRTAWLASLKMKSDPELPEHAIVDAKGRSRCFIQGALEDADYPQLLAALH
jgi:thiol-disulfide isomerase/thioredoxin